MNELKLISPIPPSVNHYTKSRYFNNNGRNSSMVYVTGEAKKYKREFGEYVKNEAIKQGFVKSENKYKQYDVQMTCYFNRTDMDAQNYDKCLLDAITECGHVWIDDNVVALKVNRIYYDRKNPRIELTIKERDYIGIFDSEAEMARFEDRCKSCSRYKRNCSILSRAKNGFIQDEIIDKECMKYKKRRE